MRCCWTKSRLLSEKVSKLVCTSPYITAHLGGEGEGEEREGGKGEGEEGEGGEGREEGRRGRGGEESRGGEKEQEMFCWDI